MDYYLYMTICKIDFSPRMYNHNYKYNSIVK